MAQRVFGHIPGYPEGSSFRSRAELSGAGVHRPTMAGIAGSESEGADSIVLSGGYEDWKVRIQGLALQATQATGSADET